MESFITAQNWNRLLNKIYSDFDTAASKRSPLNIDVSEIQFFDLAEAVSLPLIAAGIRQDRDLKQSITTTYHRHFAIDDERGERNLAAFKYLTSMHIKEFLDKYSNSTIPTDTQLDELIKPEWRNYKSYLENAVLSLLPTKEVRNELQVMTDIIPRLTDENSLRAIEENDEKAIIEILGMKDIAKIETKQYKRNHALLYGGGLGTTLLKEACQNVVKHGLIKSQYIYGVLGLTAYQRIMRKPHFSRCADWQINYFDTFDEKIPFMRFVIGDNGPGIQATLEANFCKHFEHQRDYYTTNYEYMKAILEWSFDRYSSSDSSPKSATTGLYRIKEFVEEYNGLLSVCSGGVRIVKGFDPNGVQKFDEEIPDSFKGTLIDAVFPLIPESDKEISKPYYMPELEFPQALAVVEPNKAAEPSDIEVVHADLRCEIQELKQRLQDEHARAAGKDSPLVVDLCDRDFWSRPANKERYEMLLKTLSENNQTTPVECYLLGVTDSYVWPEIKATVTHNEMKNLILGLDITASGTERGRVHCRYVGAATTNEEGFVKSLTKSKEEVSVPTECVEFARQTASTPWLTYNHDTDKASTSKLNDSERITQIAIQGFRQSLLNQLNTINQSNGINGWVCIDGRYYVSEYMPVEELLKSASWKKWIEKLLLYTLSESQIRDGIFVGTTEYSKQILNFLESKGFSILEFDSIDDLKKRGINNGEDKDIYEASGKCVTGRTHPIRG